MNQNHSPNSQEMSDQEKEIYIMQTIKVEQDERSLFYDTGCCDVVSRYAAIKPIGKRASKEFSGPVTLGGVGNAQIYQVIEIIKLCFHFSMVMMLYLGVYVWTRSQWSFLIIC